MVSEVDVKPNQAGSKRPQARAIQIQPPQPLDLSEDGKLLEKWRIWKQQYDDYLTLSQARNEPADFLIALFRHTVGPDAMKIISTFTYQDDEDRNDWKVIARKLETFCAGQTNETYERYKFNNRIQGKNESFNDFLMGVKSLAASCNFCTCMHDSLIRDRITTGLANPATTKRLLQIQNLTLKQCIDICRGEEAAERQTERLYGSQPCDINKIKTSQYKEQTQRQDPCPYCNTRHKKGRNFCPAWGKTCSKCAKANHFAACCKSNISQITDITEKSSEEINNVHINRKKAVYAKMIIEGHDVRFQLDSGASVNIIPERYVTKTPIIRKPVKLCMWNGAALNSSGHCTLNITNPKNGEICQLDFQVINANFTPILGLDAIEKLRLVQFNYDQFVNFIDDDTKDIFDKYSVVFDGRLGTLPGCVHLHIRDDIKPRILPARRIPFALDEKFRKELDKMVEMGVITKVDEPTEWVSQVVVTTKKSGELRVCIDPKFLNEALKREHYRLPLLEDILPALSKAKYFTKVDLSSAFWHCKLDEPSSYLTTFGTPFGRYRWLRLPFGLKVSSEIFQKRILQSIDDLQGTLCIADDILIHGATRIEHDNNVERFLQRCIRDGIKLKREKVTFCTNQVTFHGHLLTDKGVKPDPGKIEAIINMPTPKDRKAVARLNGMINYLSRFLPKLADIMAPIRQLTHKNEPFCWNEERQNALDRIKRLISEAPVLAYFNPNLTVEIQCDSSQDGLGAVLLQNGKPLDYRSRTLSDTEKRYAQIEKELLAVVYAAEKFHDYIYGRPVKVYTDHHPLITIAKKPLHDSPRRLQSMLLRLQKYDIQLEYKAGRHMTLADTLSRAMLPTVEENNETSEHVHITLAVDDEQKARYIDATKEDPTLTIICQLLQAGWPDNKATIPDEAKPFHKCRAELRVEDGLIFRNDRIVVPTTLRKEVLRQVHGSHLGLNACYRRAKETVYWPGITAELKQVVMACEPCRKYDRRQTREPMKTRDIPNLPWEMVASDLFQDAGKHYLITTDYYSDYFEIDQLKDLTSTEVIKKLRSHFARHGIPRIFISDGGPQFSSEEFQTFSKQWKFQHHITTPYHSQSNGKAESAVKEAKKLLKKCAENGIDPYLALLEHRNTPTAIIEASPNMRLFGRTTRTLLPISDEKLKPQILNPTSVRKKLKERMATQKLYYDNLSHPLVPLKKADQVWVQSTGPTERVWEKGTIVQRLDDRSYRVRIGDRIYRRNRINLKKADYIEEEQNMPIPDDSVRTQETTTTPNVTPHTM